MRLPKAAYIPVLSVLGVLLMASPAVAVASHFPLPLEYWTESPGGSWTLSPDADQLSNLSDVVAPTTVGHDNGDQAVHVFTVDEVGNLWDSFSANPLASPAVWSRTDITTVTGGFVSTQVAVGALYLGGGTPSTQVFALSSGGHMLSFTTAGDGGGWHVFDLTAISHSGADMTTAPHPIKMGSTVAVYATDSSKHLHDFYKPIATNWADIDITHQTGENAIFGVPYLYGGNSIQTVSTSPGGHLITFIQIVNPDGTLNFGVQPSWADITLLSGNTELPFGTASPVVATGNKVHILVDDKHNNLVDFTKTPTGQWQVATIAALGFADETPSVFWSPSAGWHVVVIIGGTGMVDYTSADGSAFTANPVPHSVNAFGDPSIVAVGSGPQGPTFITVSDRYLTL